MMIYFDNAATMPVLAEVRDEMRLAEEMFFANPSSLHRLGFEAEKKLNEAREIIAASISAAPKQIIFTSSATESNNSAIFSAQKTNKNYDFDYIKNDHPSVLEPVKQFQIGLPKKLAKGGSHLFLGGNLFALSPNEEGAGVDEEKLEKIYIRSLVNSVTGLFLPLAEMMKEGTLIVDAVQGYMKYEINIKENPQIDFLITSSHKIGGPKGVSFLYAKNPEKFKPLIFGGGQERGLRSGTENLPAIIGFAKAVQIRSDSIKKNFQKVSEIKEYISEKLKMKTGENESPYILSIPSEKYPPEVLVHMLSDKDIFVSAGSACSSKKKVENKNIRLSFSPENTLEEAEEFCMNFDSL
jgi:cysteine desulfurase